MAKTKLKVVEQPKLLKLDLGCGKNKREGFIGVDVRQFDGVDLIADLRAPRWNFAGVNGLRPDAVTNRIRLLRGKHWIESGPFDRAELEDNSISEANCSHFVEHLTGPERIHFVNELYRVLIPGGKCTVVVPHWASNRAYGDLTHQWPPVSEMWFYYLSKEWRATNAPHNDFYACDFDATWGYAMHPAIQPRNQEYQQHAMQFFKEACQDMIATLVKRG